MADKYGSYYNNGSYDVFRAAIRYEITSKTSTQYEIRCRSWVQMGDGHDDGSNIQGRAYITNEYSKWVTASGRLEAGDESGWLGDITKTITRTHSDQTITCSGQGWASTWDAYTPWVNATVTVPAKPSYAVKYNANGGSGAPSAQTKWYGESLTLRTGTPTRTGYSFRGWATTSTGSVKYAAGGTYTANAAVTLYAVWQALTYTVSYNANGGSGTTASQTKNYNQALTLRTNGFTRTNYVFDRWNTKTNGSGTYYAAGGTLPASVNQAVTLYAIWYAPHTVSYDGNAPTGATVSNLPSSQTKVHGTTLKLSTKTPVCVGYDFLGWATTAGGNVAYQPGADYTSDSANVTLYAKWRASSPTVTVSECYRSDDQGASDDEGGYVTVSGSWTIPESASVTIAATLYEKSDTSHETPLDTDSDPASGTSGDFSFTLGLTGGQPLDPDTSYEIIVTGTNDGTSATSTKSVTLSTTYYPIDVLDRMRGKGIAFGKAATQDGLADFGMGVNVDEGITAGGIVKASQRFISESGVANSLMRFVASRTDTGHTIWFGIGNTGVNRGIWDVDTNRWVLCVNSDGENVYGGTPHKTTTNVTLSNCTATSYKCWSNGIMAGYTLRVLNVSAALASGSSVTVGTLPAGYRPIDYHYAVAYANNATVNGKLMVQVNTNGTMSLFNMSGSSLGTSVDIYVSDTYPI